MCPKFVLTSYKKLVYVATTIISDLTYDPKVKVKGNILVNRQFTWRDWISEVVVYCLDMDRRGIGTEHEQER